LCPKIMSMCAPGAGGARSKAGIQGFVATQETPKLSESISLYPGRVYFHTWIPRTLASVDVTSKPRRDPPGVYFITYSSLQRTADSSSSSNYESSQTSTVLPLFFRSWLAVVRWWSWVRWPLAWICPVAAQQRVGFQYWGLRWRAGKGTSWCRSTIRTQGIGLLRPS